MNAGPNQPLYTLPDDSSGDRNAAVELYDARTEHTEPQQLSLSAFLRKQAQLLIDWTLNAELQELLIRQGALRDHHGRPAFVRNGYQPVRDLLTNVGPVSIRVPKLRSRVDRPLVFRSSLARPYLRRSRIAMSQAPAHFLRALSTGDMHSAISALMGPEAAALPGPVMRRLAQRWESEHKRWLTGSLARLTSSTLWLDCFASDESRRSSMNSVMLAVAIDDSARKQMLAVADGGHDTVHGWAEMLRGLRSRGMPPPLRLHPNPEVSSSISAAAKMVYPETALR